MNQISTFFLCINCFLLGACAMLIALCIQPEVVAFIRKVYCYDFKEHREQHEKDEGLALLQSRLNHVYDLTRDTCSDELDAIVGKAWDEVDASVDDLKFQRTMLLEALKTKRG